MKKRIAIVGASGYTGMELLRLLRNHNSLEVGEVYSRSLIDKLLVDAVPSLAGLYDGLKFKDTQGLAGSECDGFFLAVPHTTSADLVKALLSTNKPIVDLAADFRMSAAEFAQVYGVDHALPEVTGVYGAPELWPAELARARLVANPGCFAYCILLGIFPLLKANLVYPQIQVNAITGSSGSGAGVKPGTHHPLRNESVRAYSVFNHRHVPEIESVCERSTGDRPSITLVNQSGPFTRGIFATIFLKLRDPALDARSIYAEYYRGCTFIREREVSPDVLLVRGSNFFDYAIHQQGDMVVVCATLDNLIKGAAGTALQCMNLMLGCNPEEGLLLCPLVP